MSRLKNTYEKEIVGSLISKLSLKNKHDVFIDTIFCPQKDWMFDNYEFGRESELVFYDSTLGWKMYAFDPPIQPGDEFTLEFSGERKKATIIAKTKPLIIVPLTEVNGFMIIQLS